MYVPSDTIRAVHTGANAAKGSPEDAGGLEVIILFTLLIQER